MAQPTQRVLAAIQEYAQLHGLLLRATTGTLFHRLRHGPRRANWSPEFEALVQLLTLGLPNSESFSAQVIRTPMERLTSLPLWLQVEIQPDWAGPVPGEWLRPPRHLSQRQVEPIVLFFHGGGYIAGSPRTHRLLTAQIARVIPAQLWVIDYRLAPEHPYPAALVDAWAAYWWLLSQEIDPQRIILAGDSAGGGLAVALALALRDAHVPLPAGVVCLSPWFDLALEGASIRTPGSADYLNEQLMRGCARHYLNGVDPHTPLASPLYGDLAGLPPLLIQASTGELLVDDARRFARRARAAGVAVELDLWADLVHVWQFFHWITPAAREALDRIGDFVRRQTGTQNADPNANRENR